MCTTSKVVALVLGVFVVSSPRLVGLGRGRAQPAEGVPARSVRGGSVARTAHYGFEVFGYRTGLRVFAYDPLGVTIGASSLTGTATFFRPTSPAPWFARPLHPSPATPDRPAVSLDLVMDLRTVPASGATVALEIAGLPAPDEPMARFTVPFVLVPDHPAPARAVEEATPAASYPAPSDEVHHYTAAGFYRMTSGAVVWVPGPGDYYGTPAQYYPHSQPGLASGWVFAQRAPEPAVRPAPRSAEAPESIQWEPYWRPRAMGDTESYQLWLHGEMWRQRLAGRSPARMDGECARCHRR